MKNRQRNGGHGSFFGGMARFVCLVIIAGVALGAGMAVQGYLFFTQDLPGLDALKNYEPPVVTEIYSDKGRLIAELADQRRYLVPISDIPMILQQAFIAAEDKKFWQHKGVDQEAIVRAAITNIRTGKNTSGASTITQQLAKMLLLTREKTYSRKIKEAVLSIRIEKSLSKDQILYRYLNHVYLGSGAHGVKAAARMYFGKKLKDLTIAECAMLAGLVKAPSVYTPKKCMSRDTDRRQECLESAKARRKYVLGRMLEEGHITTAQYEAAADEPFNLVTGTNVVENDAADFIEHVRQYVENKYGRDRLYKDGLKIYTTVDLQATTAALKAVQEGLGELDRRQGYRGPIRTLDPDGVKQFLNEQSLAMEEPLRFGDVVEGVVTHIDESAVYVHMGRYTKDGAQRDYVGKIPIDPDPQWWVRRPYVRAELRTRNFAEGDLPFQVGDVILARLEDPNVRRMELYREKYGNKDPELKNYKRYTEDMLRYFPLKVEQEPMVEAALMFRENRTGYVRAMIGGRNPEEKHKFNRAVQSRRQPGSSFKPVIYAAALNKDFTAATVIDDRPFEVRNPVTGEVWRPKNYMGGHKGRVRFREALVKSLNIPTIKILQQIGIDHAKAYARKLGYRSPLANNLTLALGSTGVSLEEQIDAYSVFPNKGYLIPCVYIKKIVDRHGNILEEHQPPVLLDDPGDRDTAAYRQASYGRGPAASSDGLLGNRVPILRRHIDEATACIMNSILQDVVQNGTAKILKRIVGRTDIAGKTGTTNDNIDAWFMGFSPGHTCGVWVGFDDEHPLGEGETGGKAAAPIWGYFMRDMLDDSPERSFPETKLVEVRTIDPETGLPTATEHGIAELFKVGSLQARIKRGVLTGIRRHYSGSDLDQF